MSVTSSPCLPVFLAANDWYACFAATAMMSIAENTRRRVHFHLYGDGISTRRAARVADAVAPYRHAALTILRESERRLDGCNSTWYGTRVIFSRYFLADRFPAHDLLLYVDVDTIFRADIADLFALGTGDHGLAACRDTALHEVVDVEQHKSRLGIAPEHVYFNNGMILIDGPWWRRNRVSERLTAIALDRRGRVTFPSQDPMNIEFSPNRYRLLPQRWNYMPSAGMPTSDPAMLHFTLTKPWNEPDSPGADQFWEIARRSPFAREICWRRQRWRVVRPLRRVRNALSQWFRRASTPRFNPTR